MKKRIYIDFDGVLNKYVGWKGSAELFEPQNGAVEFLNKLSQNYEIYIFTTRNPFNIAEWLIKYDLRQYISNITNIKEPAYAYIDDRAIKFEGNYSNILAQLEDFKPYWQEQC